MRSTRAAQAEQQDQHTLEQERRQMKNQRTHHEATASDISRLALEISARMFRDLPTRAEVEASAAPLSLDPAVIATQADRIAFKVEQGTATESEVEWYVKRPVQEFMLARAKLDRDSGIEDGCRRTALDAMDMLLDFHDQRERAARRRANWAIHHRQAYAVKRSRLSSSGRNRRASHGVKTASCGSRRGSTTRSSAASGDSGKPGHLSDDGELPKPRSRRPRSGVTTAAFGSRAAR